MAMGYDGSIKIDTRIETKNFNAGMKRVTNSIGGALKAVVLTIAKVAAAVALMAAVIGAAFIAIIGLVVKFSQKLVETLYKNLSTTSAMRDKVVELKGAFDTLKGTVMAFGATLLNALAPILMKIIDWLVKAVNWVSMFIAVLTKQKTVMQYVSGAVDSTAGSTGKLAKETKKVEKAAKGALAAFDEINVLQQDTADLAEDTPDLGGGGGGGGEIMMEEVPVEKPAWMENLANAWEWLKETIRPIWEWLRDNVLLPLWNWFTKEITPRLLTILGLAWDILKELVVQAWKVIEPIVKPIVEWLWEKLLKPIAEWTGGAILDILDWIIEALTRFRDALKEGGIWAAFEALGKFIWETFQKLWEDIKKIWEKVVVWFKEKVTDPLKEKFAEAWEKIKKMPADAWEYIKMIWNKVKNWFDVTVLIPLRLAFENVWSTLKRIPGDAWEYIKMIWGKAKNWFDTTVLNPIKRSFETTFGGIKTFVKNTINSIIDLINGMIRGITTGINAAINALNLIRIDMPAWLGGGSFGLNIPTVSTPQIPRLAKGAIIPPNAEFAAILGDQRSGRNIEAPEGLIRQIIQEEIGNIRAEVDINFTGSLGQLVRELKPHIDRETIRIGSSLVRKAI